MEKDLLYRFYEVVADLPPDKLESIKTLLDRSIDNYKAQLDTTKELITAIERRLEQTKTMRRELRYKHGV